MILKSTLQSKLAQLQLGALADLLIAAMMTIYAPCHKLDEALLPQSEDVVIILNISEFIGNSNQCV